MAVTNAGSVFLVTADNDTVKGPIHVCGIKYIAGTGTPSIQIRSGGASGMVMWETDSTTDLMEKIEFRSQEDLHIDLAGTGTLLYLYTEV